MLKNFLALTSAFALASSAYATDLKYSNPVYPEMPILAWYSIMPDSALTPERYNELREAGFNLSFSHFKTNDQIEKALKVAEGTGVKMILTSYDLVSDTKGTVDRFKGHNGVAGWFLRDEPTASGFAGLAAFRDNIAASDSTHLLYLNLLPSLVPANELETKDYDEYVQRFIDEVRLPQISFDLYPVVKDDSTGAVYLREQLFENLEIAHRVAERNGIPFWAFCLSTAHTPYPVPTATHMRVEAFSALAYGAQAIEYFTYWQPESTRWNFHNAPIDETGKRTDVYYLIKDLNREIQSLAPVFLGAKIDNVALTGETIPAGTTRLEALPAGFDDLTSDGEGVVVSQFHNNGIKYLMFVNRDIHHAQTLRFAGNPNVSPVNGGNGRSTYSTGKIVLAPGDYCLLQYN